VNDNWGNPGIHRHPLIDLSKSVCTFQSFGFWFKESQDRIWKNQIFQIFPRDTCSWKRQLKWTRKFSRNCFRLETRDARAVTDWSWQTSDSHVKSVTCESEFPLNFKKCDEVVTVTFFQVQLYFPTSRSFQLPFSTTCVPFPCNCYCINYFTVPFLMFRWIKIYDGIFFSLLLYFFFTNCINLINWPLVKCHFFKIYSKIYFPKGEPEVNNKVCKYTGNKTLRVD